MRLKRMRRRERCRATWKSGFRNQPPSSLGGLAGEGAGQSRPVPSASDVAEKRSVDRRLTAYEFSGNNRANARLLSAATRG